MTVVVRILQGLLVLAGLIACVSSASMAIIAYDDVSGRCYMRDAPEDDSLDKVPSAGCPTVSVFQVEAIGAAAVGFAGIGVMIGAVAVGRMAPRRDGAPKPAAAPHGYGPPPGPQHQPSGPFPQPGHQPGPPYGPQH